MEKTYYEILGVERNAHAMVLRKAHIAKARAHHPDQHIGESKERRDWHEARLQEVNNAYDVLSNPAKRIIYDHEHPEKKPEKLRPDITYNPPEPHAVKMAKMFHNKPYYAALNRLNAELAHALKQKSAFKNNLDEIAVCCIPNDGYVPKIIISVPSTGMLGFSVYRGIKDSIHQYAKTHRALKLTIEANEPIDSDYQIEIATKRGTLADLLTAINETHLKGMRSPIVLPPEVAQAEETYSACFSASASKKSWFVFGR